jgi:DNA-damage-inducible protein J
MAGNTINLSIRLESELKSEAEKLLSDFGMSMTTAINIYLRQMVREQKIPFQISMHTRPMNLETLAAMQEALQLEKPGIGKTFRNIDELREDLLS